MIVYHGSTQDQCNSFCSSGIDGHKVFPRAIHGPQDGVPGLFVTPDLEVAKRFGICVVSIEVELSDLAPPPAFILAGADLETSLKNPPEPQAFLAKRIEPSRVKIVYFDETRIHG
ncbi:hypothetical protein [Hylemonella gracilis]|uniref:hypothetical protein n=1 Tax=Hylemonella gracilis TaxID=80880 RepID=UPI0011101893|nr:hypothetical protein [Hylemonella gracilis]